MKILVSDFDNTIYTEHYLENIKEVNKFVEQGNLFIIATGRNIKDLLKDLNYPNIYCSYIICNDGGSIFDKNLNPINRINIDDHLVKPIINMLIDNYRQVEWYIDNGSTLINDYVYPVNGIIAKYYDSELAINTLNSIVERFPEVHGYLSERWINITNKLVSKGNAIDYLVKLNGYNEEDVFVIGDGINDISMLEKYHGYAVLDSKEEVQKVAKEVIPEFKDVFKRIK